MEFYKTEIEILDYTVEGFEDDMGNQYVDNTQLAKLFGKQENSTRHWFKSNTFKDICQRDRIKGSLEDYPIKIRYGSSFHSLVPIDWAIEYIRYQENRPKKSKKRSKEKKIQNNLAKELNGDTEVKTEVGCIDVLTEDYAIEVKKYENWKYAIGQILSYTFFVDKIPTIVLYDKTDYDVDFDIIESIAEKHGIEVYMYDG